MSNIKINYFQFHGVFIPEYKDSPFCLDGVGFEPEMVFKSADATAPYFECPAWKHKVTRTFLIKCPIDIELRLDSKTGGLYSPNIPDGYFEGLVGATFVPGWRTENRVTIQLSLPKFLFWTEHKNIWVEVKPHYLTAVKNNLSIVPAWYNISNWIRPIGTAFNIIDQSKPVKIKRGDVLYEVSFYSNNLDRGILLNKKEPSEQIIRTMDRMSAVKRYIRQLSSKFLFKNTESKCPFHFMWK